MKAKKEMEYHSEKSYITTEKYYNVSKEKYELRDR